MAWLSEGPQDEYCWSIRLKFRVLGVGHMQGIAWSKLWSLCMQCFKRVSVLKNLSCIAAVHTQPCDTKTLHPLAQLQPCHMLQDFAKGSCCH